MAATPRRAHRSRRPRRRRPPARPPNVDDPANQYAYDAAHHTGPNVPTAYLTHAAWQLATETSADEAVHHTVDELGGPTINKRAAVELNAAGMRIVDAHDAHT